MLSPPRRGEEIGVNDRCARWFTPARQGTVVVLHLCPTVIALTTLTSDTRPSRDFVEHLYETPVPPSRIEPSVPSDVEAVLLSCLAKCPERRPQDATALRARLLACEDAGRWSDEDAHAWWAHAPRRDREPAAVGTASTLAFSATDRGEPPGRARSARGEPRG
jgi:hypothetical protein